MRKKKYLKHDNFLLLSHYATFAMQDVLWKYLIDNYSKSHITRIDVPLPELPFLRKIEIARYDSKIKRISIPSLRYPSFIAYPVHFLQVIFIIISDPYKYDYAVAQNSLLATACIVLRSLGKIRKVIYYSHGIDNVYFKSKLLNWFYKVLDSFAARSANINWVLGNQMISLRKKQIGATSKIFWVPASVQLKDIKRRTTYKAHTLVFLGTLNSMNGVMILPGIIKNLKETFPTIILDIIGDGPLKSQLKEEIQNLGLTKNIRLLGLMKFEEYKDNLTKYQIAIAPYKYSRNNLLQLTDPMKLRIYSMAGLPIITTKGFPFADEAKKYGVAKAVKNSVQDYCKAVSLLLSNNDEYSKMRSIILDYSRNYDQKNILDYTFQKLKKL